MLSVKHYMNHITKNKKYHTVRPVPKSNSKTKF